MSNPPEKKSDEYWKEHLSSEQYKILREKGTEAPFTGELLTNKKDGTYHCVGCDSILFSSKDKFDSGTGWPSFGDVIKSEAVELLPDSSHGMERTEVVCATCGGHLGHVFDDGPENRSLPALYAEGQGKRYCINSTSLSFCEQDNPK